MDIGYIEALIATIDQWDIIIGSFMGIISPGPAGRDWRKLYTIGISRLQEGL